MQFLKDGVQTVVSQTIFGFSGITNAYIKNGLA